MVRCPRCGKENPDINTWCYSCGAELDVPDYKKIDEMISGPAVPEGTLFPDAQIPTYYRTFKSAIKTCMKEKYATFSGRACRSEFWFFYLFNWLISWGLVGLLFFAFTSSSLWEAELILVLSIIFLVAFFVPNLAVSVRRLHDIGHSGWWLLTGLIPYVGILILLVFFTVNSQSCDNRFGLAPHEEK